MANAISFHNDEITNAFDNDEYARTVNEVDQATIQIDGIEYAFGRLNKYPEEQWFFDGATIIATGEEAVVQVQILA